MNVLDIVMTLIVVGFGLWVMNSYIPMTSSIKKLLNGVVIVAACVWLLRTTNLWPTSGPLSL
jgi:hypothetical protein